MTDTHPNLAVRLVRSVAILALPSDAQVDWLTSLGLGTPDLADELAQELSEHAIFLPQFLENGWISANAAKMIDDLDRYLERQREPSFWTVEALKVSSEWEHVRRLARSILNDL